MFLAIVDDTCTICGQESEYAEHAVVGCPRARRADVTPTRPAPSPPPTSALILCGIWENNSGDFFLLVPFLYSSPFYTLALYKYLYYIHTPTPAKVHGHYAVMSTG